MQSPLGRPVAHVKSASEAVMPSETKLKLETFFFAAIITLTYACEVMLLGQLL